MSQLSFQVKIHAHYKTNVEDLFDEMFDLAKRLNADISGAHSWQNVLVSPSGYATVEVPLGRAAVSVLPPPGLRGYRGSWGGADGCEVGEGGGEGRGISVKHYRVEDTVVMQIPKKELAGWLDTPGLLEIIEEHLASTNNWRGSTFRAMT